VRLLFIISGLSTGGAEVSLVEISNKAVRLGHDVHVVSLTKSSAEFCKRFDERVGLSEIDLRSKWGAASSLYKLRKIIKAYRPDIVHSHMVHANLFAALCKLVRIFNAPLFATAHSIDEGGLSVIYRFLKGCYDHSVHISGAGLGIYIEKGYFDRSKSSYIPNGVTMPTVVKSVQELHETRRFVTLGRLVRVKNHRLMIDAIVIARKCCPEISLSIFGVGPCYDDLKEYIVRHSAESYVFLMGETSNPHQVLAQHDCFLLSSDVEGMPMSLLEACAAGLACAVTDVGSCKEVLDGLPCCFVSESGDTDKYFANVIELARAPLSSLISAKLIIRERISSKYSIESTFHSLHKLYRESLG
jgi:glycosyltransferase involved in cell wall biosynthesis